MFIANWKMNGSISMINDWLKAIDHEMETKIQSNCIFCPPACFLSIASELILFNSLEKASPENNRGKESIIGTNKYKKSLFKKI